MSRRPTLTIPTCAVCTALLLGGCGSSTEETATPEPAATTAPAATDPAPVEPAPKPEVTTAPGPDPDPEPAPEPAATAPEPDAPAPEPPVATAAAAPKPARVRAADGVLASFIAEDPDLRTFADKSYGYAIFPSVVKGGLIVSGAAGDGVVYEQGKAIGYSKLSQGGIGATVGGQEYSEIIFFETAPDLERFKNGNAKFSAQASAVAIQAGASADAAYSEGTAIFTMAKGGLMLDASIGGQGFSFEPLE